MASLADPNPNASGTNQAYQYGRQFQLLVSNKQGKTIDLSQLRCKFAVKKTGYMTPNGADIYVYNMDISVAMLIQQAYTKVILQAGYQGNFGVIFKGDIKQIILGRENATDTFINILGGDGDEAFNYAIVNTTVGSASAGGASPSNQLAAATTAMASSGVGTSYIGTPTAIKLPRGKVMYGNAKNYMQKISDTNSFNWSIQDEQIVFIPQSTYLPNQAVVLTSKTGMIGTPQQTIQGIQCKCLLNPKIRVHGRVQIDNKAVAQYKIDFGQPGSAANTPTPLSNDGMYVVYVMEHSGDTRGTEWYTNLTMLVVNVANNPRNSVNSGDGS